MAKRPLFPLSGQTGPWLSVQGRPLHLNKTQWKISWSWLLESDRLDLTLGLDFERFFLLGIGINYLDHVLREHSSHIEGRPSQGASTPWRRWAFRKNLGYSPASGQGKHVNCQLTLLPTGLIVLIQ